MNIKHLNTLCLFLIVIFGLFSCKEREGRYIDYYDDGHVKFIADYTHGKLNGEMRYLYNNGHVNTSVFFKNDEIDSTLTQRNMMGRITLNFTIDSNLLNGSFLTRYKNDRVHYTGIFKGGKPIGPAVRFYENGSVWGVKQFNENHQMIDTFRVYYESGKLMIETIFSKGKAPGPVNYWNEDGFISMGGLLRNGRFHEGLNKEPYTGGIECFYKTGQQALAGNYTNGLKTGDWKGWYYTGIKSFEGRYEQGKAVGSWKYWTKDGDLICEFVYQDGRITTPIAHQIAEEMKLLAKTGKKLK